MCLTVLIWLIKIAAFLWVSGGIHLQPVQFGMLGGSAIKKKIVIYIHLYLYVHIK